MSVPDGWSLLLVRYGEVGIKSAPVRVRWERRLGHNLEDALLTHGVEGRVVRERGRLFLHTNAPAAALEAARHTFGVVSVSSVVEMKADADTIAARVGAAARGAIQKGQSFAVRARRTGQHPFTSMQLAKQVGSAVYTANEAAEPRVDLSTPDVEFHIEVRDAHAYFYRDVVPGPGGLPLGVQGRVAVVATDARGILVAWLMMRRGCKVTLVVPERTTQDADVQAALRALHVWAPHVKPLAVPVPEAHAADPAAERAFLLAVTGTLARGRQAHAIAVADGVAGAVAWHALDEAAGLPVLRPLTGYPGAALAGVAHQAELGVVPGEPERAPATLPELDHEDVIGAVKARRSWVVKA